MSRLPQSKVESEYPLNQVSISRAGHETHVDDTPGAERLRQAHAAGTYWEIGPDGRRVTLIVADEYNYIKGGMTLTVDNNGDVRISGNMRVVVEGDCYMDVGGDLIAAVSGNSTVATVGDSVVMTGGDSYSKIKGSSHTQVDGNMNADVKGDAEISVKGDTALVSKGNVDIEGNGIRLNAKTKLTLKGAVVDIVRGV